MPDPETTSEQIKTILESIRDAYHYGTWPLDSRGDGAWTQLILQKIGHLGTKKGLYVCTKQGMYPEANYGEWLFDLCWLEYAEGPFEQVPLISVPLALECEWQIGISHIKHDFEKLLLTNANLKVMIFQQETLADAKETCAKLREWIERFGPSSSGRYLLCCYVKDGEPKNFHFEEI